MIILSEMKEVAADSPEGLDYKRWASMCRIGFKFVVNGFSHVYSRNVGTALKGLTTNEWASMCRIGLKFVVNGFSHVNSMTVVNRRNELCCKRHVVVYLIFMCLAFPLQLGAVSPPVLNTMTDLDQAVENAYDGLTNSTSALPPGDGRYEIADGYLLFSEGSEIAASTNLFRFSPRMGIPVWTVRIVETQLTERVWLYEGDGGAVFRTNSVPSGFNANSWVEDVYGGVPDWLGVSGKNKWYAGRDRSRIAITLSLIASNNWADLEDAWHYALTNSPPADTNSVAFTDVNASDDFVSLDLYAPTCPMSVEVYSASVLPTNGLWSVAGMMKSSGPFGSWYSPVVGNGSAGASPSPITALYASEAGEGEAPAEPCCFFNAASGDVDFDADGIPDGRELFVHGTYTNKLDSDFDGLSDFTEIYQYETDPGNPDGDADSIPDGWEVDGGMNPFNSADIALDPDNDHLYNIHEFWADSDPQEAETNSYAIADVMQAVDLSISGLVASASIKIFSTQDHSNTNYVRNTNCWAYAYDLTCCSPWNSYSDAFGDGDNRAGTLISPRHVIFAAHYDNITTNDVLRFVDIDNNVIERKLIAKKQHPDYPTDVPGYPSGHPDFYPDFTIGLLESDVPTNQIGFARVLPDDYQDYIGTGRFLPALCLDQEEKALVADLVDLAQTNLIEGIDQVLAVFDYPVDTNRLEYSEEIILGDSGNPAFLIIDDQLVILSVWTYGDAGAGTSLTVFKDDINQIMTDLGGGYQLSEIDLSGFSSLVH